ncbi:MAG: hypothetical protein U9O95_08225 [Candidatus Marinimicrobia bacterium]|nr:hypothetical protein [Candidatus Neomarinimicrobiota bacterium]
MKKFSLILIIVTFIILLTSCGQEIEGRTNHLDELKLQYDHIGIEHNRELDRIHDIYKDQIETYTYSSCLALADEYFASSANSNIAHEILSLIGDVRQFGKSTINSEVVDILNDSIEVISKYPEIFDSISVILDSRISVDEKRLKLENIYLLADEIIENEEDKESIMNGISTTIHSLAYWDENYIEWQGTLLSSFAKPTMGIIGALGIIDGAGAVIGTLEGIRDTDRGQEGRGKIIIGRAIGEAAKTSTYAVLAIILL